MAFCGQSIRFPFPSLVPVDLSASRRDLQCNIERVELRRLLATHEDLARKVVALENKYDAQFKVVFDAIRELMAPPSRASGAGFKSE